MAESRRLFLRSTCPSPLLPPSSLLPAHPVPLSFPPSSSPSLSPSNFSSASTIEMSSLSPVEQGITAQVDWFNTAVRSPLQPAKMFTQRYMAFDPITALQSVLLCFCLSSMINRHWETMILASVWWKSEAYHGLRKINIHWLLLYSGC